MAIADQVIERHGALPVVSTAQIAWLRQQGVPDVSLHSPDFLVRADVVFDGPGRFSFPDEVEGDVTPVPAVVIVLYECDGTPGDLGAWSPRTNRLASWFGRICCLGDAYAPRLTEEMAVDVHPSPIEWLKAGREGIVVIPDLPIASRQLWDAGPFVACGGDLHAARLRAMFTAPLPRIFVRRNEVAA